MKILNVSEAKTHLSHVIEEVEQGEQVLISKRNVPVVKLVAVNPPVPNPQRHRTEIGWAKGTGVRICGDINEPVLAATDWEMLQ
jgi:prevent-host-death family protein